METVTLKSVRRIQGRAELQLSTGETVSMPRAMLKERPYRAGMPFDRQEFSRFILERAYPFAMDKAVSLLASRARTEKEICDALHRNAYPDQAIARVMQRLNEAGYINDPEFASNWASARTAKGLGTRRIRMELRHKGVEDTAIDEVIASIDEDDQFDGALKTARKAAKGKDMASPADRQKVLAALIRRGFDFSVAKKALQALITRSDETDDF